MQQKSELKVFKTAYLHEKPTYEQLHKEKLNATTAKGRLYVMMILPVIEPFKQETETFDTTYVYSTKSVTLDKS